jgi:hypothetical protein
VSGAGPTHGDAGAETGPAGPAGARHGRVVPARGTFPNRPCCRAVRPSAAIQFRCSTAAGYLQAPASPVSSAPYLARAQASPSPCQSVRCPTARRR